jgi:2,5-dioxopentanoate dehydrogenase
MHNEITNLVDAAMDEAWQAFAVYSRKPLHQRARLMRTIAAEIEALGGELIQTAMAETHLPEARLKGERARTVFQLSSYADACEAGHWLEASIDTALSDKVPPKPDTRKMRVALGPVVVFGAANFPFAYSTAGGDTASALAAGCTVVVKAHSAHLRTSGLMASAIEKAVAICGLPKGVFSHLYSPGNEIGQALVIHSHTRAVGFTGSFSGGKQLFDWANQRPAPIPVFAEMSSINPVFLLPEKLQAAATETAQQYAASITLGVGQFCTNPGLIIGIEGPALQAFTDDLAAAIKAIPPGTMLHQGIADNYAAKRQAALAAPGVATLAVSETAATADQGLPTIATTDAVEFLNNPLLHQEVFGPYSLVVACQDMDEMLTVAQSLEGQLTATLMATDNDLQQHAILVDAVATICGRLVLNGVPLRIAALAAWAPMPSNGFADRSVTKTGPMPCCPMN